MKLKTRLQTLFTKNPRFKLAELSNEDLVTLISKFPSYSITSQKALEELRIRVDKKIEFRLFREETLKEHERPVSTSVQEDSAVEELKREQLERDRFVRRRPELAQLERELLKRLKFGHQRERLVFGRLVRKRHELERLEQLVREQSEGKQLVRLKLELEELERELLKQFKLALEREQPEFLSFDYLLSIALGEQQFPEKEEDQNSTSDTEPTEAKNTQDR